MEGQLSLGKVYLRGVGKDADLSIEPGRKINISIDKISPGKEKKSLPPEFEPEEKHKEKKVIINRKILRGENERETLNCMYTLEPIKGIPIGIPITKEEDEDNITYYCVDVFGTFNDALAETIRRRRDKSTASFYDRSENLLKELFKICHPNASGELLPSPDNRCLEVFNGNMKIEEFRMNGYLGTPALRSICQSMANLLTF